MESTVALISAITLTLTALGAAPVSAASGRQIATSSATKLVFTQLSAGYTFDCGLTTKGNIVCWGNNDWGAADPPSGHFIQVSAGGRYYPSRFRSRVPFAAAGMSSAGAVRAWARPVVSSPESVPQQGPATSAASRSAVSLPVGAQYRLPRIPSPVPDSSRSVPEATRRTTMASAAGSGATDGRLVGGPPSMVFHLPNPSQRANSRRSAWDTTGCPKTGRAIRLRDRPLPQGCLLGRRPFGRRAQSDNPGQRLS